MPAFNTWNSRYTWTQRSRIAGLGMCLLWALCLPASALAKAMGSTTASLLFEITSPSLPAGLTLNGGGTSPTNFLFPEFDNSGTGSLTGMGAASCTPAGCTNPLPGANLKIQLSNDLSCTSSPDGKYGGLEDSFANFGARNTSGFSRSLDLRFTTSWSVSSTITDPAIESAAARVDLLWAVPVGFCIELTSCASGFLSGSSASASCPAGSLLQGTLVLGRGVVNTTMGNNSAAQAPSSCAVKITVPQGGASSGGDIGVTSSCSSAAVSATTVPISGNSLPAIIPLLLNEDG